MKNSHRILTLSLGSLLAATVSVNAQITDSDGFSYPTGALSGSAGGTGWGGAWNDKGNLTAVTSNSLSYTDGSGNTLATSGGSLVATIAAGQTSSSTEGQRQTSATFGTLAANNTAATGTLWMSYLWQGLNTTGNGTGSYRQAGIMFLQGATSSAGSGKEFLDFGMPNITNSTYNVLPNFSLWGANGNIGSTLPGTAPLQTSVAANTGATYFVLMQFVVDNTAGTSDTVNIWLDPTLGGTLGTPTLTYAGQDLSGINGIRFQSGGNNANFGALGGQQQADELRLGDTVGDVEPLAVATPEPASMALAAVGGLGLLALRRKR